MAIASLKMMIHCIWILQKSKCRSLKVKFNFWGSYTCILKKCKIKGRQKKKITVCKFSCKILRTVFVKSPIGAQTIVESKVFICYLDKCLATVLADDVAFVRLQMLDDLVETRAAVCAQITRVALVGHRVATVSHTAMTSGI